MCSAEGSCKLLKDGPHRVGLWHYLEGVQRCAEWEVSGGDSGGSPESGGRAAPGAPNGLGGAWA